MKDDIILTRQEDLIITKWQVLKPRNDFTHGVSVYLIDKNIKISRFYGKDGKLLYYYCDIIKTLHDAEKEEYIFCDLLIDVVIYPDGKVRVLDVAEVPEAMELGLIDINDVKLALNTLDTLLRMIDTGKFQEFSQYIDSL